MMFSRSIFLIKKFNHSSFVQYKRCFSNLYDVSDLVRPSDPHNNVSNSIARRVGRKLHLQPGHPLNIIKCTIEKYFEAKHLKSGQKFKCFDDLSPIVSTKQCFDDLLTPVDHVSRQLQDTYYISKDQLLRTHTSAHQTELLREGNAAFLCSGDVYRRDTVDASHYPIFHQMEGVKLFDDASEFSDSNLTREEKVHIVREDLKKTLVGMIQAIFGDVKYRWVDAFFPFTDPSLEMEIYFNNDWLEVLGCGVIQQDIVRNSGLGSLGESVGWAFGLGLERLAMILFNIPDIRLFWSEDRRFISQFKGYGALQSHSEEVPQFVPYSKYPAVYKDVSFWTNEDFHSNDIAELVRNIAGDLVEDVSMIDTFTHPATRRVSECYRITYRHMDKSLTSEEVNEIQEDIRSKLQSELKLDLR